MQVGFCGCAHNCLQQSPCLSPAVFLVREAGGNAYGEVPGLCPHLVLNPLSGFPTQDSVSLCPSPTVPTQPPPISHAFLHKPPEMEAVLVCGGLHPIPCHSILLDGCQESVVQSEWNGEPQPDVTGPCPQLSDVT